MVATIIGLAGPKGVGKTTVAQELCRLGAFPATIVSHPDPIKAMLDPLLSELFPSYMVESLLYDKMFANEPIPELGGKTPRQLMQSLGTEWGRDCVDKEIWNTVAIRTAERHLAVGANLIVFDSVRFPNEAQSIKSLGGKVFVLYREGVEPSSGDTHQSETHYPELGQQVHNAPDDPYTAAATILRIMLDDQREL